MRKNILKNVKRINCPSVFSHAEAIEIETINNNKNNNNNLWIYHFATNNTEKQLNVFFMDITSVCPLRYCIIYVMYIVYIVYFVYYIICMYNAYADIL